MRWEVVGLGLDQTDCSHWDGLALPAGGRAGPSPSDPAQRVLHVIIFHPPPGGGRSGDVPRQEEENHVEIVSEPLVHPVVDDGVDASGGHGQPVEGQVDVVDVGDPVDGGVVVGVDEVDVIWSPADHEDPDHHREHLDQLTWRQGQYC